MLRFIHAADIHLDSPMRGLPDYPGAPIDEIRAATRRALEAMVDLALEENVDLVLIAGDLYDGDWRDYNTGLFLAAQMARLRDGDIRVIIARGNHDAASQITRYLSLPENVTVLDTKEPETVRLEDLGVAVHGQGFEQRNVEENVVLDYPPPLPGLFNIGMLHTSAGRSGHDEYAPCSVQDLVERGYQYWALGHIHARQTLSDDPLICFPGNLQGRSIRETGPKGCLLVAVDGGRPEVEERDFDIVRWEKCQVPCDDCGDAHELLDVMRDQFESLLDQCSADVLATRVVITGDSSARESFLGHPERWLNEVRQVATEVGSGRMWLEKIEVQPSAPLLQKNLADDTAVALLQRLDLAPEGTEALCADADLRDLMGRLPAELREEEESLELGERLVSRLMPQARALVLESLQAGGDEE